MLTGQLRAEVQENPYVNLSATELLDQMRLALRLRHMSLPPSFLQRAVPRPSTPENP